MTLVVGTNTNISLADADAYFATRYNSSAWTALTDAVKTVLLKSATRVEDLFCVWSGYKTDPDQDLEFPRDDEDTPDAIKYAECEIAFNILASNSIVDESNPKLIKMKVDVIEFGFQNPASTRTLYNGIVTDYLKPYCKYGGGSKKLIRV